MRPLPTARDGRAKPSSPSRFDGIEAGRGCAALLVVLHHASNIAAEPRFFGARAWNGVFDDFNVGVDFFFVLSGFIITWVHWRDVGKPERAARYALRRWERIYPPYWILLVPLSAAYFLTPAAGKSSQHDPLNLLASIFLFPYPAQPIIGVAWTLVHEVMFYVVFGVLILRGRRWLGGLVLWGGAILVGQAFDPLPYPLSIVLSPFNLEFLMGIGAALILRRFRIPAPRLTTILGGTAFLALLLLCPRIQDVSLHGRLAFGSAAFVGMLGVVEWERSLGLRVPRPLLALGTASYAIYLIHTLAMSPASQLLVRTLPVSTPVEIAVTLLALVGVAMGLLYHAFIEKPIAHWLKAVRLSPRAAPYGHGSSD